MHLQPHQFSLSYTFVVGSHTNLESHLVLEHALQVSYLLRGSSSAQVLLQSHANVAVACYCCKRMLIVMSLMQSVIGSHTDLECHILLEHPLQLVHLLTHGSQGRLHLCHLHLAPLPVALLRLLVLQLLPGCTVGAAQGPCAQAWTLILPAVGLNKPLHVGLHPRLIRLSLIHSLHKDP